MLVGNQKVQEYLNKIVISGDVSHGYLFVGPENIGKTSFAVKFARSLLCTADNKPCYACDQCRLFDGGNHPDFLFYDGDASIGVDETRELIRFLELKPYQAAVKVAVIAHAERMTDSAANSFLKTLEEPSQNTLIILTAENTNNLLPTIVSRTQVIRFLQPQLEDIKPLFPSDYKKLEEIYNLTSGKIGLALSLSENDEQYQKLSKISDEIVNAISHGSVRDRLKMAEKVSKEKDDLRLILNLIEVVYREKLISEDDRRLNNVEILDKLSITKELLNKNVNPLLALESFLLIGAK